MSVLLRCIFFLFFAILFLSTYSYFLYRHIMDTTSIRVRFAPSPTGFMHLGNVRAALINYLFAHQKSGTFILRIEDTDAQRMVDPMGARIMEDISWLHLTYDEGPQVGGPYEPYYQSQRTQLYTRYLNAAIEKNLVYRCFCTIEELEKKRQRQLALKQPPRYDRCCLRFSPEEISQKLSSHIPFIWRFKLDHAKQVSFYELARKTMHFELKHFSDVPVTREDGSFTFLFANFIDDVQMKVSHVFRGEDHLSNTAVQVAMYEAFNAQVPTFWHLPIITNTEGKKLSKRDFGFSLTDLKNEGYLPQAICNYIILMGGTFQKEIMTLSELTQALNFDSITSTSQIKYDVEKLRWVNHQWIMRYDTNELAKLCRPYLDSAYSTVNTLSDTQLATLISYIQPEIITLKESIAALSFYFTVPIPEPTLFAEYHLALYQPLLHTLIPEIRPLLAQPEQAVKHLQAACKAQGASIREVFTLIRIALTGKPQGLGIKELFALLGPDESYRRLTTLLS